MRPILTLALILTTACTASYSPPDAQVGDGGPADPLGYSTVCAELEEALAARTDDCGPLPDATCPWWDREGACWSREALDEVTAAVAVAHCLEAPKTAFYTSCRD